ncbi:aromatic ring-hydroxylating oxygenase subunit alpha [Dactylosporangium sp. CA-233914]|uniref:aromatic ring-hydroxylating oxygenase subunit alpha n=1 Tax=Dactylosporangium sp. CA-233914 TaxID=3239934 RepID=UPI003D8EA649
MSDTPDPAATTTAGRRYGPRQRHSKALDVARRGLHLVTTRSNERAASIYEQPAVVYLDAARHDAEIDVLFRRAPIFAGLSVEVPMPGSFKTLDIPKAPVVVSRQEDGSLRAFLNICRHRGAAVAYGTGSARTFVCKYHGWAYDLDGSLRKVRGGDNFGDLETGCFGLTEVAVAERYGLIYVRATPLRQNPEPIDIEAVLCGLAPQFEEWGFETGLAAPSIHEPVVTASNWKLAVDGYLEPYHFASLHKTTVARYNNSNQATFDAYGPNAMSGFLGRKIDELGSIPEADWPLMRHVQLIYTLFPNVILSVMQDHVEYSQIMPGTTVDTNIMNHLYFRYPEWDVEEVHAKRFLNTQWILTEEDIPMAEEVHRNLRTGGLPTLVFGRNEPALQHHHRSIEAALRHAGAL